MQVVKEWKRSDGVTVRVMLRLRGGFDEIDWKASVLVRPPRRRKLEPGLNWRHYMTDDEMQAMQRELCEKLIEKQPG